MLILDMETFLEVRPFRGDFLEGVLKFGTEPVIYFPGEWAHSGPADLLTAK